MKLFASALVWNFALKNWNNTTRIILQLRLFWYKKYQHQIQGSNLAPWWLELPWLVKGASKILLSVQSTSWVPTTPSWLELPWLLEGASYFLSQSMSFISQCWSDGHRHTSSFFISMLGRWGNNLSKEFQLFQAVKRIKSQHVAHEARRWETTRS